MRWGICLLLMLFFTVGTADAHYRSHEGRRHHRRYYESSYTIEDNTGDKLKYDSYGNYIPEDKKPEKKEGEEVICHRNKNGKIICDD